VAWRAGMERAVLAAREVLDTVIVRPALIYGKENTIWTALFAPLVAAAKTGEKSATLSVDKDSKPALCHIDDVASGLHCAVDKLPLISGTGVYPVFDLITSQESMREILATAGKALGFKGEIDFAGTGGDLFMEAMCVSTNGSSARAKQILGWVSNIFLKLGQVSRLLFVLGLANDIH
jgi:nucleoside-diphosphate-sugar epimerase